MNLEDQYPPGLANDPLAPYNAPLEEEEPEELLPVLDEDEKVEELLEQDEE